MATRPRLSILAKLILAFVVPTVIGFAVFAVVAHEVARRDLEAELGARLSAVAAAAATHVRERSLARLEPGSETDIRYQRCQERLRQVAEASGVYRIYVFDRELTSVCDTEDGVPIGVTYYQLERDRPELERVFGQGARVASILFEGNDGKLYKSGFAPVELDDGEAIEMAVGVDAPAGYFAQLADLRRTLAIYGAVFVAVVLALTVLMAALITRPVRNLTAAAERIARGDLAAPIEASSRDEIGFLAATMDRMRGELRARDERMQLMLSGIAHEVRNPLGGIELFAGILRDELGEGDADAREHVARIEKELHHLEAVVEDFLEYARRPALERETIELGAFITELCELLRADADAAGVSLRCEAAEVTCSADRRQLKRALLNLGRNAVQAATPGAGRVEIRARAEQARVVIEVSNTGAPIPGEVRERMFEPFFTTREKGTGLGLAFVREIALDHGGEVTLVSSDEAGTAFALSLPR